ncbi:hypothetical protein N9J18_00840 [Porticoccaceae bacterium]|nr:hypothetical protein [Porticoccaceae bacterium]
MSDLKVKLSSPSQTKVVLNDNGNPVTISAFKSISGKLSDLSDVNLNGSPDGSVLVFDSETLSYVLRPILQVDGEVVTLSGGVF